MESFGCHRNPAWFNDSRLVPKVGKTMCFSISVEARSCSVWWIKGNRLGMAKHGWRDDKSTTWLGSKLFFGFWPAELQRKSHGRVERVKTLWVRLAQRSRVQSTPVGGGTFIKLVEPIPANSHPMGKEIRKLFRLASPNLRVYYFSCCRHPTLISG